MYYNNLLYESRPVKFKDFIDNKYNIVHQQLYEDALHNFLQNYISDIVFKDIIYELFNMFNNFIYSFGEDDEDETKQLINYDYIKENYANNDFFIISIDDIKLNYSNIIDESLYSFYNDFITYIITSNTKIINLLNELGIDNETDKRNYIKYFLINILYIVTYTKDELYNIFNGKSSELNLNSLFDISDFIIKYKNSIYVADENTDEVSEIINLFRDEQNLSNPNYVMIYDDMLKNDIHIGYTSDGKIILDIDENIDIEDISVILNNIVSESNTNLKVLISQDLYDLYYSKHKIIEIKNTEYWKPSSIMIYDRIYPYEKHKYDLSPYWNMSQEYSDKTLTTIKLTNQNILDSTVKEFDYARGKAKMYSKTNDMTYELDFDYFDKDTEIDEELLTDTFTYKYSNI